MLQYCGQALSLYKWISELYRIQGINHIETADNTDVK